jgi:serine/threonine protein kinase
MISFSCQCGMKFQVKPEFAGRSSRCPTCQQMLVVPQPVKTGVVGQGHIDGTPSSLDRVGTDAGVTLEPANAVTVKSRVSVRDLLARRTTRGQRYVVEAEIARGGMGAVLRAVDCDIRREVAVKYLLDQADPRKKLRFIEEAQITGQLEHPNIVPIHELGVDGRQRLFFTMKMVKGRSLAQVLDDLRQNPKKAEKEYSLTRLLNIMVGVCNALAYAHSCGVVHRDLKPANIMLGDFGEVYVMDWGLAKVRGTEGAAALLASVTVQPAVAAQPASIAGQAAVPLSGISTVTTSRNSKVLTSREPEADLTQDGAVLGTPAYMPPEQATGKLADIDQRSDVYSLGAILYEMLALEAPVDKNGNYLEVLMRVSQGEILSPEARAPRRARDGKIPRELAAVAMKALARDRENRYPTATALRRDIERFQEGRSVSAKEDTAVEMCWKLVKRNKGASLAAALALVVLVCSLGFSFRAWLRAETAHAAYVKEQEDKRAQIQRSVPAFVEAARLSVERRKYDNALAQVNIAIDCDAQNAEARLLKGQVQIVRGEFAAAEGELREYLRQKPNDVEARKLADLCPKARPSDAATLLAFAQIFNQQQAPALADGLLTKFGQNSSDARRQLLDVYRKRIEAAWPGSGNWFSADATGIFELRLSNAELTRLDPLQGIPLTKLYLDHCAQLQDLTPLKGMPLTFLSLQGTQVRDLTPLQGMKLTSLNLWHCEQLSDLTPLRGMPLTALGLGRCTKVRDLTPLKGMPLESLSLPVCPVSDLSALRGMPLTSLDLGECGQVRDLTPLQGMKLTSLNLNSCGQVRDLTPLQGMKLTSLNLTFCSQVQDLTPLRGMPLSKLSLLLCSQVRDLKPLEGMPLTALSLHGCSQVRDLAALRGMKLAEFDVRGCREVRDLTPLQGMSFTSLDLNGCSQVRDLTPLRSMPLASLSLEGCSQVFDLTPLQGMKLNSLSLSGCGLVRDLAPLRGMPLTALNLSNCRDVRDLTPLHDLPLTTLQMMNCSPAPDLTPLQGMKLTTLDLRDSGPMLDLTPLAGTTLAELSVTPRNVTKGMDAIRQMKTLKTIWPGDNRRLSADDFWKRYDAGEFKK